MPVSFHHQKKRGLVWGQSALGKRYFVNVKMEEEGAVQHDGVPQNKKTLKTLYSNMKDYIKIRDLLAKLVEDTISIQDKQKVTAQLDKNGEISSVEKLLDLILNKPEEIIAKFIQKVIAMQPRFKDVWENAKNNLPVDNQSKWPVVIDSDFKLPPAIIPGTCNLGECDLFNDQQELHECNFNERWMEKVPDYMPMCLMSIPGTNDSLAVENTNQTKCQSLSLMNQLKGGIRFVDIRHRSGENSCQSYKLCHTMEQNVLNVVQEFLKTNPEEFVLMRLKGEHSPLEDNDIGFLHGWNDILWKMNSDVTNGIKGLKISDVRGKVVFLKDSSKLSEVIYGIKCSDSSKCIMSKHIKPEESWEYFKKNLDVVTRQTNQSHDGIGAVVVSFLCANGENQSELNNKLHEYIRRPDCHSCGVVVMNFPGIGLVKNISNTNSRWHHAVLHLIREDKRISDLKTLSEERMKQKLARKSDVEDINIAYSFAGPSIVRVLCDEDEQVILALIDHLREENVIDSKEKMKLKTILKEEDKLEALDELDCCLGEKTLCDLECFIKALQRKTHFLAVAYFLEEVREKCRRLRKSVMHESEKIICQEGYDLEMTISFSGQEGFVKAKQIIDLCEKDSEGLQKMAFKGNGIPGNFREKCIQLDLKVTDEWELQNLKKDIEFGLFQRRFRSWMKKSGKIVPEGATLEIKLSNGTDIIVLITEISGKGKGEVKYESSQIAESKETATNQDERVDPKEPARSTNEDERAEPKENVTANHQEDKDEPKEKVTAIHQEEKDEPKEKVTAFHQEDEVKLMETAKSTNQEKRDEPNEKLTAIHHEDKEKQTAKAAEFDVIDRTEKNKRMCDEIDNDMSSVLFVSNGWILSQLLDNTISINRMLITLFSKRIDTLNVLCTSTSGSFTKEDMDDAMHRKVTLVHIDDLAGINVTHIIGYAPVTYRQSVNIKDQYFSNANIILVNTEILSDKLTFYKHFSTEEIKELEQNMRAACRTAQAIFSVGHMVFEYYKRQYSEERKLSEKHKLIWPFGGETVMPRKKKSKKEQHILSFGPIECENDITWKGLDIVCNALEAIKKKSHVWTILMGSNFTEKQLSKPIQGITKNFECNITLPVYAEKLEDANLCLISSPNESIQMVGVDCIQLGTPVLVASSSGLGKLIDKIAPGSDLIVKTYDNDKKQTINEWRKQIEKAIKNPDKMMSHIKQIREKFVSTSEMYASYQEFLQCCGVDCVELQIEATGIEHLDGTTLHDQTQLELINCDLGNCWKSMANVIYSFGLNWIDIVSSGVSSADKGEKMNRIRHIIHILENDGKRLLNITKGLMGTVFAIHCPSVDSLEWLWKDCYLDKTDEWKNLLQGAFTPNEILEKYRAKHVLISINLIDYEACLKKLKSTENKLSFEKLVELGNKCKDKEKSLFWYDKAVKCFEAGGRRHISKSEDDIRILSKVFLDCSRIWLEREKFQNAVALVDKSLDLFPTTEGYKHHAEVMKFFAMEPEALKSYMDVLRNLHSLEFPIDVLYEICCLAHNADDYENLQQFSIPMETWQDVFMKLVTNNRWKFMHQLFKYLNFDENMQLDIDYRPLLELKDKWVPRLILEVLRKGCYLKYLQKTKKSRASILHAVLQMSGPSTDELFDYLTTELNLSLEEKNKGTLLHLTCQTNGEWWKIRKVLELGTSPWLPHQGKFAHELLDDDSDVYRRMITFLQEMYSKTISLSEILKGNVSPAVTIDDILFSLKRCPEKTEELTKGLAKVFQFAVSHGYEDDELHTIACYWMNIFGKIIEILQVEEIPSSQQFKQIACIPEACCKSVTTSLIAEKNYVSLFKLIRMKILSHLQLESLDLADCLCELKNSNQTDNMILCCTKQFIELGADANGLKSSPLEVALSYGMLNTACGLVYNGATLEDDEGVNKLHTLADLSCQKGDFELLEHVLQKYPLLLNRNSATGETLIHHIARYQMTPYSEYAMKLICSYPVNPFQKYENRTPSQLLSMKGDPRNKYITDAKESYRQTHSTRRRRRRRMRWHYHDYLPVKEFLPKHYSEEDDSIEEKGPGIILNGLTLTAKQQVLIEMGQAINKLSVKCDEECPVIKGASKDCPPAELELQELESLPYELQMNSSFLNQLKNIMNDSEQKQTFLQLIKQMGKNPYNNDKEILLKEDRVFASHLTSTVLLIWRLFVGFSTKYTEEDNGIMLKHDKRNFIGTFADQIQCMALADQSTIVEMTKTVNNAIQLGKKCRFIKHLQPLSKEQNKGSPSLYRIVTEGENGTFAFPLGGFDNLSYTIQKSYPLISEYLKQLYIDADSKIDIPFVASDKEYEIINQKQECAILLLGRSGTGKTTCCFRRLWERYIIYWITASNNNFRPTYRREHLYDKTIPGVEKQIEGGQIAHYDHLQQIFVTKNAILVGETEKMFDNYCHTYNYVTKQRMQYEEKDLPNRLQDIPSERYPLFLTARQLLLLLDASLPGAAFFFDNEGKKKFEVLGWTIETHLTELTDFDQDFGEEVIPFGPKEVTSEFFEKHIWHAIKSKGSLKNVHPSLIWTEIVSFIKGSDQAMQSDKGCLNREEYKSVGKKQAIFKDSQRDDVYNIFEEYSGILKQTETFDEMDILFKLHKRCSPRFLDEWCLHELYVDETQDFTQTELSLLLYLCQNPNKVFMTGDTAQTIMKGVTFRFQELTTIFHDIQQNQKPLGKNPEVGIPTVQHLIENYRSHEGILNLAAGIVCVMEHFFPKSFDAKLPRDVGSLPGPKPLVLESVSADALAILLRGNSDSNTQVELGANQAVLVVNDDARENLPEILQAGIVLTIYEAKGLEFDDVLLYNFFEDSAASGDIWDVVRGGVEDIKKQLKEMDEEVKDKDLVFIDFNSEVNNVVNASERGRKQKPPPTFDECKHKILNSDLKYLYTAVTRAKKRVWMYDKNEEKHKAMYQLFLEADLIKSVKVGKGKDIPDVLFAKQSTPKEWELQGDYFMKKKLYQTAKLCFEKGQSPQKEKIAEAYLKIKDINKSTQPQRVKKEEYIVAAKMFLYSEMNDQAAKCLYNGEQYELSAKLFTKLENYEYAAQIYRRRLHNYDAAIDCYMKSRNYREAIELSIKMRLYDRAVDIRLQYNEDLHGGQLETIKLEYHPMDIQSLERLGYQAANYHYDQDDAMMMTQALDKLSDFETKKTFLLTRHMEAEAMNLMETEGKFMEAASLARKCGKLDKALEYCRKSTKSNDRDKFELSCITCILRDLVHREEDKPDYNLFQRAKHLAEKFQQHATMAQICMMKGLMKSEWCIIKDARMIYANKCKSYWIGSIYCVQKIMELKKDVIEEETVKVAAHAVGLSLELANALLTKETNLHHEVIRKCEDFYGIQAEDDRFGYVKVNLYENPRLEGLIKQIRKNQPTQKDEYGNVIIAAHILHKELAKHLLQIADRLCKRVETYIRIYLNTNMQCDQYAAGYKCYNKKCEKSHQSYTNQRDIVLMLLVLIRLEGNVKRAIVKAQRNVKYRFCAVNLHQMLEYGVYEGCRILWNMMFTPSRHHWPRVYAFRFVDLMRYEYVAEHVNDYASYVWDNLTQQEKQSGISTFIKLRCLFQLVNGHPFKIKQSLEKVAAEYSAKRKMDQYTFLDHKRVGLINTRNGSCYSIMDYLLNSTKNLYIKCDPCSSMESFVKFMNITVGRQTHHLIPPIEGLLPYWEYMTVITLSFVMRFHQGYNIRLFLPASYLSLVNYFDQFFLSHNVRATAFDTIQFYLRWVLNNMQRDNGMIYIDNVVTPNLKKMLTDLFTILLGKYVKSYNVMKMAASDETLIQNGTTERFFLLLLVILMNVPMCRLGPELEFLVRREIQNSFPLFNSVLSKRFAGLLEETKKINQSNKGAYGIGKAVARFLDVRDKEFLYECSWQYDNKFDKGSINGLNYKQAKFPVDGVLQNPIEDHILPHSFLTWTWGDTFNPDPKHTFVRQKSLKETVPSDNVPDKGVDIVFDTIKNVELEESIGISDIAQNQTAANNEDSIFTAINIADSTESVEIDDSIYDEILETKLVEPYMQIFKNACDDTMCNVCGHTFVADDIELDEDDGMDVQETSNKTVWTEEMMQNVQFRPTDEYTKELVSKHDLRKQEHLASLHHLAKMQKYTDFIQYFEETLLPLVEKAESLKLELSGKDPLSASSYDFDIQQLKHSREKVLQAVNTIKVSLEWENTKGIRTAVKELSEKCNEVIGMESKHVLVPEKNDMLGGTFNDI